jgi:hypothetical protein
MAETVKKAKSTSAKPKKTAAKKKSATAASADPIKQNHHVEATEHAHSRQNGHRPASQDEIARLAHQFWLERGHKHGHHIEDWYRAEKELSKRA